MKSSVILGISTLITMNRAGEWVDGHRALLNK